MDYEEFYSVLFAPLEATIGPVDDYTIFAIMGFDGGGPLNFCTIGANHKNGPITYVSCELAVREEQVPTKKGGYRYELLTSCDKEPWARTVLSDLGRMSMNVALDHGHTVDIGVSVNRRRSKTRLARKPPIQGVLLHQECTASYHGRRYGILRCVGITRPERLAETLKLAQQPIPDELWDELDSIYRS